MGSMHTYTMSYRFTALPVSLSRTREERREQSRTRVKRAKRIGENV